MADEKHTKEMKPEKVETVEVEALQDHTYNGKAYKVGDTYDIDVALADSLAVQGKAMRADAKAARDKQEKAAAKAADDSAKQAAKKK